jgi:lipoprotein-anchoring transpeptidase ErfK/SrfK
MPRSVLPSLVPIVVVLLAGQSASAQSASFASPGTPPMVVAAPPPPPMRANLGGGFIEFLFGNRSPQPMTAAPGYYGAPSPPPVYANAPATPDAMVEAPPQRPDIDPQFRRREVEYQGKEAPGTIIVDTPNHFLYLVEDGGKALRYGIGVGREGFTWAGVHHISAKKEWPDWVPPKEMLERQPYLPHFMAGGANNPLGARAMYIGSTMYRIHGSNEPWTIGHNVSSGCIRLRNVDVIDLYGRVKLGAKVVVLPAQPAGVASAIP